jgi:hypothetical protein
VFWTMDGVALADVVVVAANGLVACDVKVAVVSDVRFDRMVAAEEEPTISRNAGSSPSPC